jgi:hypothetical protein
MAHHLMLLPASKWACPFVTLNCSDSATAKQNNCPPMPSNQATEAGTHLNDFVANLGEGIE